MYIRQPSDQGKHVLLAQNMATREMQYLRLKSEEPTLE
jgi:hypothetical protein